MVRNRQRGFTLVELLILLAVLGILAGILALNLRGLDNPLQDGASQFAGLLKQTRAKAMATTSAYQILEDPTDSSHFIAQSSIGCSGPWTTDSALELDLPKGISASATSGALSSVCFSPRGFASAGLTVTLKDQKGRTMSVELLLGGAVRTDK